MKNVSIKCRFLSNFLTFCQTLKHHFSNYSVFIRSVNDITIEVHIEPAGIVCASDVANLMKNVMHSFLSKEGVFTDFPEGMNALALASNGFEVLNVSLGRNDSSMIDTWACDKPIPKHSDTNNVSNYYIAMQEHITLHHSSSRIHNQNEKTTMCLNNVDHPSFK